MESVESIINWIFGGSVDASKIITILTAIYAVVCSILEWRAKVKLIKADKELTSVDEKFTAQQEELNKVKEANAYLANIITTAYLSSNTIDEKTKKNIAVYASKLDEVCGLDFTDATSEVIDAISSYIPGSTLNEKKEEILLETKASEEIVDSALSSTSDAIDKIAL